MAVADTAPDSPQVSGAVMITSIRWPLVEQLRKLHPPIEFVERRYCSQKPIGEIVVVKWFVAIS
eukprot:953690-Pyramimonas_sp.AAC.1